VGTSIASFIAHSALIWKSKQYCNLNKASVGAGLIINPMLALVGFKKDKMKNNTREFLMKSFCAAGTIKALYDGYDYFTNKFEDESEDVVTT